MSTLPSQPIQTTLWKQEVNRRVAAHRSRRCPQPVEREATAEPRPTANTRAAEVAARVAARYATAPSYGQIRTAEARTAVRAAEIATQVALEAHASARALLAGLKSQSGGEPSQGSDVGHGTQLRAAVIARTAVAPAEAAGSLRYMVSEDRAKKPALPFGSALENRASEGTRGSVAVLEEQEETETTPDLFADWPGPAEPMKEMPGTQDLERLQDAVYGLASHANLIEFPKEQTSHRNERPRAVAAPQTHMGPQGQLSIYEVDPVEVGLVARTEDLFSGPAISQWSGIELEAQPVAEVEREVATAEAEHKIELAPFHMRLLAGVVDVALITGAFLVAALLAGAKVDQLPSLRLLEIGSVAGWLATGLVYQILFFTLAESTPGMKYARVSLCTLDGEFPSRLRTQGRIGAMILSMLPLGLGLAWAIFDEDHLSWHDRLSKTYQRKDEA